MSMKFFRNLTVFTMVALLALSNIAAFAQTESQEEVLLTAHELARFDGQEGRKAYVAVDGVIYDLTASPAWGNGQHNGFEAGRDLTEEIKKDSPHGVAMLDRVPAVGRLLIELSLEELAAFNGKDGQKAYVAVDGVIYDMTASRAWGNGQHNGFEAGRDLTKEIKEISPHGVVKLENVVEVGRLVVKLTVEELAEFDGTDGKPAYVAVDGVIYDVSQSQSWAQGEHFGHLAGTDLTEGFADSPHDLGIFDNTPVAGYIK